MITQFARKVYSFIICDKIGRFIRRFTLNPLERRRLKSREITILSQNCVGSIWYHDLGLKFTSPTINMKFNPDDWVDFLSDFDNNINLPITFIASDQPYPVGLFGDKYFVEFVHYHSEEEVKRKWLERKARLLPRKIVLAFAEDMSDSTITKFLSLTNYKNRLLFISEQRAQSLGLAESEIIRFVKPGFDNAKLLNFCSVTGKRFYQRYLDYVDYINKAE